MAKSESIPHGTLVQTEFQTHGRGQAGNIWEDSPGENLIFSLFLNQPNIPVSEQFLLNVFISISIIQALDPYIGQRDKLEVKWPNDIYLNDAKLAGVLIESSIMGQSMDWAVVGVGLNVLQHAFYSPGATSLNNEGVNVNKWTLLEEFCEMLEKHITPPIENKKVVLDRYYDRLRWHKQLHQYEATAFGRFFGKITGIDSSGRLKIISKNVLHVFNAKEVKFLN